MHQPDRLILSLRRRILDWALDRDDLATIDLRQIDGEPEPVALPTWIEQSDDHRKRPVFDRWRR